MRARCSNPACRKTVVVAEEDARGTLHCDKCGKRITILDTHTTTRDERNPTFESKPGKANRDSSLIGSSPPQRIGRFEIRARLGEGAFGTVYRAYDPHLDREVALKVAKPGMLTTPLRIDRFLREARASAQLRHPHIVPVHDAGRDGDFYFIAAAFIEGQTLEQAIDARTFDFRRSARVVRQLAEALAYAHSLGIVHRDVKPANVMIDEKGDAHLMDFGLAHRHDSEEKLTQDGAILGTPAYIAPEQAEGQSSAAAPPADQYSLGIVLYELLCGRRPFSGPPEIVIFNHLHSDPPPPRHINPRIPRDLETICMKALGKRPGDRYAACQVVANDLRRWQEGEPIMARRLNLGERMVRWCKREPWLALMGTTVAACLVAVAVVASVSRERMAASAQLETEARANAEEARTNAEDSLRAAEVARQEAETQRGKAEEALKEADAARRKAEEARAEADKQRQRTEEALALAEKERAKADAERAKADAERRKAEDALAAVDREKDKTAASQTQAKHERYFKILAQAQRQMAANDLAGTRRTLDSCPEDLRRWEWNYLRMVIDHPKEACLSFPASRAKRNSYSPDRGTTFSPDGRYFAYVAVYLEDVKVYDTVTGKSVLVTAPAAVKKDATKLSVCDVRYSANGKYLFAIGTFASGIAGLWEGFLNEESSTIWVGEYRDLAVCPHGLWVATSDKKPESVSLWEVTKDKWEKQYSDSVLKPALSLAFSRDSKRLAAGCSDGGVNVWELQNLKRLVSFDKKCTFDRLAFSPDGKLLLGNSQGQGVKMFKSDTGEDMLPANEHTNKASCAIFSADGTLVATAGAERLIVLWDTTTCKERATLKGHSGAINSLSFSPDDKLLVSGSADGTARIWDVATGQETLILKGHEKEVYKVLFSPDGSRIATAGEDKKVRLWNAVRMK